MSPRKSSPVSSHAVLLLYHIVLLLQPVQALLPPVQSPKVSSSIIARSPSYTIEKGVGKLNSLAHCSSIVQFITALFYSTTDKSCTSFVSRTSFSSCRICSSCLDFRCKSYILPAIVLLVISALSLGPPILLSLVWLLALLLGLSYSNLLTP